MPAYISEVFGHRLCCSILIIYCALTRMVVHDAQQFSTSVFRLPLLLPSVPLFRLDCLPLFSVPPVKLVLLSQASLPGSLARPQTVCLNRSAELNRVVSESLARLLVSPSRKSIPYLTRFPSIYSESATLFCSE